MLISVEKVVEKEIPKKTYVRDVYRENDQKIGGVDVDLSSYLSTCQVILPRPTQNIPIRPSYLTHKQH